MAEDGPEEEEEPTRSTEGDLTWWAFLAIITIVNLMVALRYYHNDCCSTSSHRLVAVLCLVYVIVCCMRAVFPVRVVERTCFKTRLVTPFMDRAAATVGEMSFITLIAVVTSHALRRMGTGAPWQRLAIGASVGLIAIAQTCCWLGCMTTNQLWNATEESLWAVTFTILTVVWARMYLDAKLRGADPVAEFVRRSMPFFIGLSVVYIAYMVTTDVPMYVSRWKKLRKAPRRLGEGVREMMTCRSVTTGDVDWKDDSLWRIGYFSGAVWVAMASVVWHDRLERLDRITIPRWRVG